jgi:hypothetical protein
VAAAARALGRPLLPHQRLIVDVAGEYDPVTGAPAYGEVVIVLPRRGGKTTTTLAVFLERLRRRPDVRGFYTAQGAEDATKVLRDEWAPTIQASPLRQVIGFRYARGDAGFYVRLGRRRLSRVEIFTPNANALHGRDADIVVMDELWAFDADRGAEIDAGIRPARWARPGAQLWYVSAGGTEDSGWLHAKMDQGRAATPGVAYFEWSADAEAPGYDPYDEALWARTHPGLGTLVTLDQLRLDAATMLRRDFERSLLCVWDRTAGTTLLAGWEGLLSEQAAPTDPVVLAFDVHPQRTSAAIVAAGGGAAELVAHEPGTAWLPGRLAELCARWSPAAVLRDPAGPAGATRLELDVIDATAEQTAEACADLIDAIANRRGLRVRPHPAFAEAFAGARTYNRGDGRTVWARRTSSVDLTPLYALTLAAWGAATVPIGAIY